MSTYVESERCANTVQAPAVLATPGRLWIVIVLAPLLAIWGQWALVTDRLILDGVVLFAVSGALFTRFVLANQLLVRQPAAPTARASWSPIAWSRVRLPLLVCVASAALAWTFSDGNRLRPETVLFWFLSSGLYVLAFWDRRNPRSPSIAQRVRALAAGRGVSLSWSAVALGGVFLVAAFFRYYHIGSVPAEMTSDHAEKLLDIQDVLNGQYHIFFPRNTGRETLEFYMAIPFVKALGLSHVALKLLMATVSLLTVPLVYLIGKEMAGSRFGLLAAFFLAVSKWDVTVGRIGWRPPYYAFFTALSFYFLLRALRYGRRNDYLLCGLTTGIGLYGYSSSRAMVLLIGVAVLAKLAYDRRRGLVAMLSTVGNAALCLGLILVVLIPLGHYMVENPDMFWFRTLTRVSGTERPLAGSVLQVFLSNLANGLLMFNWRGDVAWVQNLPNDPHLDYLSGGLFFLGVVWCVHSLVKRREQIAAYLLIALVVLMLPSVLSLSFPVENPGATRAVGETPIVALLVAVPIYLIGKRLARDWAGGAPKVLFGVMLALLMIQVARVNFDRYFIDYANEYRRSARNSSEMAALIDAFARGVGSRENAYLKDWPHWVDTRNIAFNMGDPAWSPANIIYKEEDIPTHAARPGNKLYLVNKGDQEAVQRLKQRYPQGQLREQPSAVQGQEFLVFFVPDR